MGVRPFGALRRLNCHVVWIAFPLSSDMSALWISWVLAGCKTMSLSNPSRPPIGQWLVVLAAALLTDWESKCFEVTAVQCSVVSLK